MANRRMFSKDIVESTRFIKMPLSAQCLYFHLGLNADDDGIVEAYNVMNLIHSNPDDLDVLQGRGFVKILNQECVTYIIHWLEQNQIRADRRKESLYRELLSSVMPNVRLQPIKQSGRTSQTNVGQVADRWQSSDGQMSDIWLPSDGIMSAQCSVGKDSIVKDSIGECSGDALTDAEYNELVKQFPKSIVDRTISRIKEHPYRNCLNYATIAKWCMEICERKEPVKRSNSSFYCSSHHNYDYKSLEKQMLTSIDKSE